MITALAQVRAQDGDGTLTINGGEFQGQTALINNDVVSVGTLNLNPVAVGPASINSGIVFDGGTLNYGGSTFQGEVFEGGTVNAGVVTYSEGTLSLTPVTNVSTLEANTLPQAIYSGTAVIGSIPNVGNVSSLGTLVLTGSGAAPAGYDGSSGPYVANGNIQIPTNDALTLPSASTAFNFNSGLSMALGSTLALTLNTQTQTSGTLDLAGNLSLDGTTLQLIDAAGTSQVVPLGTQFTLVHYTGTETGDFLVNGQPAADGSTFTFGANTYELNYAVGDPSVVLTAVSAPEPPVWLLLGLGLGLAGFRLRRAS